MRCGVSPAKAGTPYAVHSFAYEKSGLERFNNNCSHCVGVWQALVMRATSPDLRERILAAYDNEEGTRPEIAHRFRVSLGLVKKLLSNAVTPVILP